MLAGHQKETQSIAQQNIALTLSSLSSSMLEALNGTYEGMQAALRSMPQEQLAQVRLLPHVFLCDSTERA